MIFIDSREPGKLRHDVAGVLRESNVQQLDVGDYLMFDSDGCAVGIERKQIDDFVASLIDGRLWSQIPRLVKAYRWPILLVEGVPQCDPDGVLVTRKGKGRIKHGALQMALWSLQRNYPDLSVLWSDNYQGTVDLLRVLHNRCERKRCAGESSPPVRSSLLG